RRCHLFRHWHLGHLRGTFEDRHIFDAPYPPRSETRFTGLDPGVTGPASRVFDLVLTETGGAACFEHITCPRLTIVLRFEVIEDERLSRISILLILTAIRVAVNDLRNAEFGLTEHYHLCYVQGVTVVGVDRDRFQGEGQA